MTRIELRFTRISNKISTYFIPEYKFHNRNLIFWVVYKYEIYLKTQFTGHSTLYKHHELDIPGQQPGASDQDLGSDQAHHRHRHGNLITVLLGNVSLNSKCVMCVAGLGC